MLELRINGRIYNGWTTVDITRGLRQVASTFRLSVTDKWRNQKVNIRPFDSCILQYNGVKIITGYVDSTSVSYDALQHSVQITGRSKTGDLVDCSCLSRAFKNQCLEQICESLCEPQGVSVLSYLLDDPVFSEWKPDEGARIFEVLEKLAALRGVLLTDNSLGNLVLTRARNQRVPMILKRGVNIKTGSANFVGTDRFSLYTVKGQGRGSDDTAAEIAAHPSGHVEDAQVPRYRPRIVLAEDQATEAACLERAQWEQNIRWGRSQAFTYSVAGWTHREGLWAPNTRVRVQDDLIGIDSDLLISTVTYSLSSGGGMVTTLELVPHEAFSAEPVQPRRQRPGNQADSSIQWDFGG